MDEGDSTVPLPWDQSWREAEVVVGTNDPTYYVPVAAIRRLVVVRF